MEIRTQYQIKRKKIKELEMMKAYIIYNPETHKNELLVKSGQTHALVFTEWDNEESLRIANYSEDMEVSVIGKVNDFDIINIDYNRWDDD